MNREATGFTLLEILVVLVVLGLLMAMLSAGMRFGLTAIDLETRATARNDDVVTLDQVLRKLISHATTGSQRAPLPFDGQAHTLSFTTLLAGGPDRATGGAVDVAIGVDVRHRLVLRWSPHYAVLAGSRAPGREEVLAEAIDQLSIEYEVPADADGVGDALVWRSSWTGEGLPRLVRLHLASARRTDAALPDIVVETRLRDRLI